MTITRVKVHSCTWNRGKPRPVPGAMVYSGTAQQRAAQQRQERRNSPQGRTEPHHQTEQENQ